MTLSRKAVVTLSRILHRMLRKKGGADPYHQIMPEFLDAIGATPGAAILEVGARNVTGITRRELFGSESNYTGFDLYPGAGVDVVGDAHRLSEYFAEEQFDFALASSVVEHLLFPWKFAMELNSVLRTGGLFYLSTHPVWPAHELPWDFWRFPENSFMALFNRFTGFEIVTVTEGLPAVAYSLVDDMPTRAVCNYTLNLGVAAIIRKTGPVDRDRLRWDVDIAEVLECKYPHGKAEQ